MIVSVCAPNLAQSRANPRILEDLVLVFLYTLLNRHVDGRFHILDSNEGYMPTGGGASPKASEPSFAISISLLKMHRGQVTQAPDNALTNYQTGMEQDLAWLWRACEARSNS